MAQDFEAGESFVVGGDEMPRRECVVGECQHIAYGGFVGRPLPPITPILVVDFVLLVGRLFARTEAGELLFFGNLQPLFHHDRAMVGELLLEVIDLGEGSFPLSRMTKSFNSFD